MHRQIIRNAKNNMNEPIRDIAIEKSQSWWFCENLVNHIGQIGLLRMDFPRVFILVRNYEEIYPCSFEEFRDNIAELNFLDPKDRKDQDIESILIDAWNFLSLQEAAEDALSEEYLNDEDI